VKRLIERLQLSQRLKFHFHTCRHMFLYSN
jgi:hypothetical protein